jgi:hypothetical protein
MQRYGGSNYYSSGGSNSGCGSEREYDSLHEYRQCDGNGRRRNNAVCLFLDQREHHDNSDRLVSGELYSNGNRCEQLQCDSECNDYSSVGSNGRRDSECECYSLCEQRQCDSYGRRRELTLYLFMDGR